MPRHTTESPMDRMGRHTQQQTSPSVVNGSTKSATGRQHPSPPTFEAPHRAPHRPNPSSVRPTGQLQVVDCRSNAPATPDVTLTLPTPTAVPSCGKSLRPTRSRSSSLESLFSDEKEPASPTQVSLLAPVAREPAPTVPATKPAPTTGPTLTLPSGPATKNPFLPTAGPVAFGAHVPIEAPTPPTPKPAILVARPPPQPQYRWVFAPRGHDAFGLPIPAPPEEVAATFTRAPFALQPLPRGLRLPKAGPAKQLPLGAQSPRSVPTSRLSGGGPPAGHSRSDTPSRVPGATGVTNAGRSTGTRAASSAKPTAPTASESSGEASTPKAPTKARAVAGRSGPKATPKKATQVASGPAVASGANGKGTEPVRVSPSKVEAQNKLIRTKFPGLVMKYSWLREDSTSGQVSTTTAKATPIPKEPSPAITDSEGSTAETAIQVEEVQPSIPSSSTGRTTALARKRARKQKDSHDSGAAEAGLSKRAKRGME